MADTPFETDLIVIGGGPAGCAAARMAASVGMSSILVEPDRLCRNLYRIPALNNVLGGHTSGPELADSIGAELEGTELCRLELGRRVTELRADEARVTVTLDTGVPLTAPYAVVATGVGPLQVRDVAWISAPEGLTLPPLWQAEADEAEGRTLLVLGGDRPIGTFLRAYPTTETRLLVAYPADDAYKIDEVRADPRVTPFPVGHLTLRPAGSTSLSAEAVGQAGTRQVITADAGYLSLGNDEDACATPMYGAAPPGAPPPVRGLDPHPV